MFCDSFYIISQKVNSETLTMPTSLTADTSDFVLLSSSGTTPSISGYSGTLLVSAVASAGNVKVTTTTNLLKAAGYCGYKVMHLLNLQTVPEAFVRNWI